MVNPAPFLPKEAFLTECRRIPDFLYFERKDTKNKKMNDRTILQTAPINPLGLYLLVEKSGTKTLQSVRIASLGSIEMCSSSRAPHSVRNASFGRRKFTPTILHSVRNATNETINI